ncbi:unnamed protein product [Rhizoctonia solani]|uniref:Uncharacterized protein n=1 Tax=Rhizoctonia solani TaxID=456999 RepID=A0A8H3A9T4_9AGAM|nr:unnamed protein product [Rhizoctonia solani]
METSYKPHASGHDVAKLTSRAPVGAQSGLQQWFRGLSSDPVPHYTAEALDFCQKRWQTKWDFYKQTQQEQHTPSTMGKQELLAHVKHLEDELTRLQNRFIEMDMSKKAAEMDSIAEPLEVLKSEVKSIDQVYQFAIQSLDTISRLHVQRILEMRTQTVDPDLESAHSLSVRSESGEQEGGLGSDKPAASVRATPVPNPGPSRVVPSSRGTPQNEVVMDEKGILQQGPNWFTYPPNTNGAATEVRESNLAPVPAPAVTQALSTAASHRATLLSLSAVSFFGAGMAWATVFSVGTVSAACGTSLLDADGTLVERFLPVRWAVRLLSLCATMNAFAGIMLVSAAILTLDPNAETPLGGIGSSKFNVAAERVAGAYSLVVCGIVALSAFVVRRRYTRRTWFVM